MIILAFCIVHHQNILFKVSGSELGLLYEWMVGNIFLKMPVLRVPLSGSIIRQECKIPKRPPF
jgi:hypothetical protein